MDSVFKALFFRQPLIHYVSPPVCENLFSSSSGPVIVLNTLSKLHGITGIVQGGVGNFWLVWGSYPGAICYSVYKSTDPNDPNGTYVLVAECIPDPTFDLTGGEDGYYVITAITPEGETPFSDPFYFAKPPQQCPHFDLPEPDLDIVANIGDDVFLGPFTTNEGLGFGLVNYIWFKDGLFFEDTTFTTKEVLALPDLDSSDEGLYTLEVSVSSDPLGLCTTIVSAQISLLICPGFIAPLPESVVDADVGDNVDLGPFEVDEASCVGSVTYEWYKDNVFYADTTATTQGALSISNVQETDEGNYSLHITCASLGCDEKVSGDITLNVGAPVGCGATPTTLNTVAWYVTEVVIAGCQECTFAGATGTVHLQLTACDPWYICCPCCADNASTDMVGVICNPGAAYDVTATLNFVTSGVARDTPFMSFSVQLDGVSQGSVVQNPVTDTPISFTFSLPPGTHTLRAYVTCYAPPFPFEGGTSTYLDGTITWS